MGALVAEYLTTAGTVKSGAPAWAKEAWMRQRAERRAKKDEERGSATIRWPHHALADPRCRICRPTAEGVASGYVRGNGGRPRLCGCVKREAFQRVMEKRAGILAAWPPKVKLQLGARDERTLCFTYAMPEIETLADIEITARRALGPARWPLFRLHYLRGLDWRRCLPRLARLGVVAGTSRGNFFHECYKTEERCGALWLELAMV
jgi:hypothetical protein